MTPYFKTLSQNAIKWNAKLKGCAIEGEHPVQACLKKIKMHLNAAVDNFAELCSRLETEEDKSAMELQQGKLETFMSEAEDASRSSVNTVAELNAMRTRVSGHVSSGLAILAWAQLRQMSKDCDLDITVTPKDAKKPETFTNRQPHILAVGTQARLLPKKETLPQNDEEAIARFIEYGTPWIRTSWRGGIGKAPTRGAS